MTFLRIGLNENLSVSGIDSFSNSVTNCFSSKALQICNGFDTNLFNDETCIGAFSNLILFKTSYCLGALFLSLIKKV